MSEEMLPLFPLQVVLFPSARIPLHIFEPRYKTLITESIRDEKEFGLMLAQGREIAGVGCSALVVAVLKLYDDGRLDVVIEGRRPFRLHRYEADPAPYLVGAVEFLGQLEEVPDPDLADETVRLYNDLVKLVYKGSVEPIGGTRRGGGLSYLLAQKAGMDLGQRQQLLETLSENRRLHMIREYLTRVLPKLERAGEMERITRSDGYLTENTHPEEE